MKKSFRLSLCAFLVAGGLAACDASDGTDPQLPDDTETGGTCCPDGNCVCRGNDPSNSSLQSLSKAGPFKYKSYSNGMRNGSAYAGATIYYPTDATGPLSGIVICPGFTALQSSIAAWGPFFASHGIVLMTIDTNTVMDQVNVRDDALLDALATLVAENTRSGSPLNGKLSKSRFGLSGWSMGGGGTWMATAAHPSLKTGMTLAGHNATAGMGAIASGVKVPTVMFCGALDTAILGGGNQSQNSYNAIPASTPKLLYEVSTAGHMNFGGPTTASQSVGGLALAFQKTYLEGDRRYRKFLSQKPSDASDWKSNLDSVDPK